MKLDKPEGCSEKAFLEVQENMGHFSCDEGLNCDSLLFDLHRKGL